MNKNNNKTFEPVWTVSNIIDKRKTGPGGDEIRHGTKHFSPGTKVYIIDWYAGMCEDIIVVGMARKPRRFIKIVIRADWVENLRVKMCYDPKALEKIYAHFNFESDNVKRLDKDFAETMYKMIPYWQKDLTK